MENLKYSEILKANNKKKKEVEHLKPYRIKVLSNITCNQLSSTLSFHLYDQRVNPVIEFGNYDNIIQDSFSLEGVDLVIVHYDLLNLLDKDEAYYEDYPEEKVAALEESLTAELGLILQNISHVPCAVFDGFTASAIPVNPFRSNPSQRIAEHLNRFVQANKAKNTYWVDTEHIIRQLGARHSFDFKLYTLSKTLYTIDFWKEYTYALSPLLLKLTGHAKKAVVFDCDNTLWKGILGEDGMQGIDMSFHSKMGAIYHKVQQMAVWLSKHGVIIGLCSKNNPEDVQEVLEKHPDMALRNQHIVISEVNWNDKASNLKLIAENLNIGLDSILFVDDSSFEINLVKEQLPQVTCLQVPEAIYEYPQKLAECVNRYFYFSGSKDDLGKTEQYKQQANRNKAKGQFHDIESFLSSLDIQLTVARNDGQSVERIAQLTQKTNQFNLCTHRYTDTQIADWMADGKHLIYSVSVKDKFGDLGLTAVAIVTVEGHKSEITDFLMSCRIMGRNIEFAIMDTIWADLKKEGCEEVTAHYLATAKNKPVSDFYEKLNFKLVSSTEEQKDYQLNVNDYTYKNLNYIKIL
jgi:FkbH-like protein